MQVKETLFEYLYRNLREQIISGQLPYGSRMPSITRLSELYHVGIRTVRDVLQRLKEEGYIQTEERKPILVAYKQSSREQKEAMITYLLEHKQSILDVYATMTLLMPQILTFCTQVSTDYMLEQWSRILHANAHKPMNSRWKTLLRFFYALLDQTHNLFFRDLFSSLELYARPLYFFEEKQFTQLVRDCCQFHSIAWVQEPMVNRQAQESRERLTRFYASIEHAVQLQLHALSMQYPKITEQHDLFSWHSDRGRDHLHVQITRELIDQIGTGKLPVGTLLPSEAQLAKHYHVSVATIRKSLASLNELGYAKTKNVKGTTVCMQDDETAARCMSRKAYRDDIMRYLSGLQLMILTMKPAARSAFPAITKTAISQLHKKLQYDNRIPLDPLTELVTQHVQQTALQTILRELSKILCWGYYYSFYPGENPDFNELNRKSMQAVRYLEQNDEERFVSQMCLCYVHILEIIREHMIAFGLSEATYMKTPPCDSL